MTTTIRIGINDSTGEEGDPFIAALKAASVTLVKGLAEAGCGPDDALHMMIVVRKNGGPDAPPTVRIASNIAADRAMDFLELLVNTTRAA